MPQPRAYLLTWTCKGTWLPGDERGSFEWRRGMGGFIEPNPKRSEHWNSRLKHPPIFLDERSRSLTAESIREACEFRGWWISALNVRTSHVHVVVNAPAPPEEVMRVLKARATRLLRERGLVDRGKQVWTRHGSTRYLWEGDAVDAAVDYVLHRQ